MYNWGISNVYPIFSGFYIYRYKPLANWNAHPRDLGITLGSQKSWIPGEYTATDNICHFGTRNNVATINTWWFP